LICDFCLLLFLSILRLFLFFLVDFLRAISSQREESVGSSTASVAENQKTSSYLSEKLNYEKEKLQKQWKPTDFSSKGRMSLGKWKLFAFCFYNLMYSF
jgi:hypothetical protein